MTKVFLKIKTLEELLCTKGVTYRHGAISYENEDVSFLKDMFYLCGEHTVGELRETPYSHCNIGGWTIAPWMCSEWEEITESKQAYRAYHDKEFIDGTGSSLRVELNTYSYERFIQEDEKIYVEVDDCGIGLTIPQAQEVILALEEIINIEKLREK